MTLFHPRNNYNECNIHTQTVASHKIILTEWEGNAHTCWCCVLSVVVSGRISLCGCLTVRVGDHKVKQDPRKLQDFKKQFQTSNFSAGEYVKWKRSGQAGADIGGDK